MLPDSLQSQGRSSHCGCCSDIEHTDEQTATSDSEATTQTEADGNNLQHTPADRQDIYIYIYIYIYTYIFIVYCQIISTNFIFDALVTLTGQRERQVNMVK